MFQESKSDSFRTKEWEFIRNVELYSDWSYTESVLLRKHFIPRIQHDEVAFCRHVLLFELKCQFTAEDER